MIAFAVSRFRSLIAAGLVLLAFPAGLLRAADTAAYQRALEAGKAQLEAGQLDAALKEFQQAVQADGSQYEGFFYLAVASFRSGDHAAATEYASAALAAAKGPDQARARELADAIRKAKETEELARQADEALDQGLIAKAAGLYTRAFELAPDRGDLGLKAATLLSQRLNRLLEAAALYHGVVASGDANAATAAGSELGALHDRLTALYQETLPRAVASDDPPALGWLCKAFPQEAQPRFELAVHFAARGDGKWAVHWLREAVKRGTGYADIQARTVFLDLWEKDSGELRSFLADAFGPDAVKDLDQRLDTRQKKEAFEKALAIERARFEEISRQNRLREQQLAQEKIDRENAAQPLRAQLRRRVVEQLNLLLGTKPAKQVSERRKNAYYSSLVHDYVSSLVLRGNDYVLDYKSVQHAWGRKGRNGVTEIARTYVLASMKQLAAPAITAHWFQEFPKDFGGSFKQLRTLKIHFGDHVVSTVTQRHEDASLAESNGPYNGNEIELDFFVGTAADADRVAALFLELKSIDSLTLEQLQEKTRATR